MPPGVCRNSAGLCQRAEEKGVKIDKMQFGIMMAKWPTRLLEADLLKAAENHRRALCVKGWDTCSNVVQIRAQPRTPLGLHDQKRIAKNLVRSVVELVTGVDIMG